MQERTIVVTGGAGFIGSNLVDALLAAGDRVVAIDDLSMGSLDNLTGAYAYGPDRFRFVRIDITDPAATLGAVADARPDAICHLAAQINVRASVDDPLHDARVNVLGTLSLLEAARRHEVGKVVLATSGGCIYGEPDEVELPVPETYPGHAHSPYGASKRCAGEYLRTYASLYGVRWTSLALSNVYGPRQDPAGEAGVVAIFAERMLADEPVTIFGDGQQTRDFVHVSDVVAAFLAALGRGDGERFNIGSGHRTDVNVLCELMLRITGSASDVRHASERQGELRHSGIDIRKARSLLGWTPQVALRDGLEGTIRWTREERSRAPSKAPVKRPTGHARTPATVPLGVPAGPSLEMERGGTG